MAKQAHLCNSCLLVSTYDRYCPRCRSKQNKRDDKRRKFYKTRLWQVLRAEVLKRNPFCVWDLRADKAIPGSALLSALTSFPPDEEKRIKSLIAQGKLLDAQRLILQEISKNAAIPLRCGDLATEVDHIIPREKGGLDELHNLQGLCKRHHSLKTWMENREAKNDEPGAAEPPENASENAEGLSDSDLNPWGG